MPSIEINSQFEQVLNFVNCTNQNIFLTGKAGTGKTTLLKHIRQNTFKQMAVLAPTGVAAINAGGSTIHSFFQFPFTPFLPAWNDNGTPDFVKSNLHTLKYNSQRLAIFRNLDLLIIDEVSMVRADLLDQIDFTLRYTRKKWHLPFGGVQMLLIGDMYQLPPVVQPEEKKILVETYNGFYFFESFAVKNNPPVFIELTKIYRQSEQTFVELLNKVRNNQLDETSIQLLNSRFRSNLTLQDYSQNITLTTHNKKADRINEQNIANLPGSAHSYTCIIENTFPEKNYPVDETLVLKKGARVMFLKNNPEKNYYNGKIGLVTSLSNEKILVKCEEDKTEIEVVREVWENVSYKVNKASKHVEEEILGTFEHFPLRLAWAITIHKSQGLTFDRLIIDAAESFSAGQVYVALSRCRSFEGLTLSTKINRESLYSDGSVTNYSATKPGSEKIISIYKSAQQNFIKNLLLELFDFTTLLQNANEMAGTILANKTRINTGIEWFASVSEEINSLNDVALKFKNQLLNLLERSDSAENDPNLQDRIKKASVYFEAKIVSLNTTLKNCTLVTESKEAATELNSVLQLLFDESFLKHKLMKSCLSGFSFSNFIKEKLDIKYPDVRLNVYASAKNAKVALNVQHPQLYKKLLLLRDDICNDEGLPIYLLANAKTLTELTNYLPVEPGHLLQISGFGKAKVENYGNRFLSKIKEYMEEHNLTTNMDAKILKQKKKRTEKLISGEEFLKGDAKKPNTKEQTYNLYKAGFTLDEIAKQRGFTIGTIEAHLLPYLAQGQIELSRFVAIEKQKIILKELAHFDKAVGLTSIKSKLPDDITYSEIKFVLAAQKTESSQ